MNITIQMTVQINYMSRYLFVIILTSYLVEISDFIRVYLMSFTVNCCFFCRSWQPVKQF